MTYFQNLGAIEKKEHSTFLHADLYTKIRQDEEIRCEVGNENKLPSLSRLLLLTCKQEGWFRKEIKCDY